jgi:hypothetical protein
MATTKIPSWYRIFFLYIDPLIGSSGLYIYFFDHPFFLKQGIPSTLSKTAEYTPLVRYLLFALGSHFIAITAMQVYLLQAYKDAPNGLNVRIWKFVQVAILLVDLGLLGTIVDVDPVLARSPARWEQGEWSNFGILGLVIAMRSAFLLGIGF